MASYAFGLYECPACPADNRNANPSHPDLQMTSAVLEIECNVCGAVHWGALPVHGAIAREGIAPARYIPNARPVGFCGCSPDYAGCRCASVLG